MPNRESPYPTDALSKGMRTLLDSLPSEKEKAELLHTLKEAQEFLSDLSALVEAVPTMESSAELSAGLSRLYALEGRTQTSGGLRRMMGLRSPPSAKPARPATTDAVVERAMSLQQQLDKLDNDGVQDLLEFSAEHVSVLVELARRLGMRARGKERKLDLARRIATYVINNRSYRSLRGEDPITGLPLPRTPAARITAEPPSPYNAERA